MLTTPTISHADVAPAQGGGPNRPPPQAQAAPEARRFAELLQRRRDAQPPSHAPQPEPPSTPTAPTPARPIARAAQDDAARAQAADDDAPSDDRTLGERALHEAPAAAAAPKSKALAKGAPLPPEAPHDGPHERPAVDMLPPQIASDAAAASSADPGARSAPHADADATAAADPTHALAGADPAFWPGVALAPIGVAPAGVPTGAAPFGAGAAGAVAGTAGALPGAAAGSATGPSLAGCTAGDAGTGRDGAGAGDRDGAAPDAAALLAATAPGADASAAAGPAGERFALPPRTPDVVQPGWAGGVVPHRTDAAAAAPVALPTPLHAPDFAKALGAQVSVFARNGLAHAELQLTPAEMGPIQVQIAIDGAHARVDFAADSAATRQVIERGLPELASALREQGLTLAGGGVFQRAPDQSGENDASDTERAVARGRRRATVPDAAAEPARVGRVAARPGGVDLYA